MNISQRSIAAAALLLVAASPACGDDNNTTQATSSTGGNGAAGGTGGTGGIAAGGSGGTAPACGNGTVEQEVCLSEKFIGWPASSNVVNVMTETVDLELVDCDNDGDLDVLVLGTTADNHPLLSLRENIGGGQLEPQFELKLESTGVLSMTFDPTTEYDERFAVVGGSTLNVVNINTNCALSLHKSFALNAAVVGGVAATNLDDDGTDDYVVPLYNNGGNLQMWFYRSTADDVTLESVFQTSQIVSLSMGLDAGSPDATIVAADSFANKVRVHIGGITTSGSSAPTTDIVGAGIADAVIADFDNGADSEIATANKTDNTISLIQALAGYQLVGPNLYVDGEGDPAAAPIDIVAGDIDGDGDPDIVTGNEGNGGNVPPSLTLFLNQGKMKFTVASQAVAPAVPVVRHWPIGLPMKPRQLHIVDFNGDGAADLVFLHGIDQVGVMLAKP